MRTVRGVGEGQVAVRATTRTLDGLSAVIRTMTAPDSPPASMRTAPHNGIVIINQFWRYMQLCK